MRANFKTYLHLKKRLETDLIRQKQLQKPSRYCWIKHCLYFETENPLTYAGTRNVDGQMLTLLKRGTKIMVLLIDQQTARRLKRLAVGDTIIVTNLEVDLNFMYRIPLWPITVSNSYPVGDWQATGIPVLDIHELAAGKLAALMARRQARDLFDSHAILQMKNLNKERLRIAFVVYGATNRKDWRSVSVEDVDFDETDLTRQLLPTLRISPSTSQKIGADYGTRLVAECRRQALSIVLPFNEAENTFFDLLLDRGEIDPTILTADPILQKRIQGQPLLEWKALNVRKHQGLG